ncbi:hypothetical protein GCM10020358_60120 [Amorphoplanes nipponensis]
MVRRREITNRRACARRGLVGPSGRTAGGDIAAGIAHLHWYALVPGHGTSAYQAAQEADPGPGPAAYYRVRGDDH